LITHYVGAKRVSVTVVKNNAKTCREGNALGRDEGRVLGLQKGFEMGYELGFYAGCIHMWQQVDAAYPESLFPSVSTLLGGKVRRAVSALDKYLKEFPFENPRVRLLFVSSCGS
jgi:hypothetical protein